MQVASFVRYRETESETAETYALHVPRYARIRSAFVLSTKTMRYRTVRIVFTYCILARVP